MVKIKRLQQVKEKSLTPAENATGEGQEHNLKSRTHTHTHEEENKKNNDNKKKKRREEKKTKIHPFFRIPCNPPMATFNRKQRQQPRRVFINLSALGLRNLSPRDENVLLVLNMWCYSVPSLLPCRIKCRASLLFMCSLAIDVVLFLCDKLLCTHLLYS